MKKIELHLHTDESSLCGKVPAARMIDMYHEGGYDAVVVTDHFARGVLAKPGEKTWEEVLEIFLRGYREAKKAAEKYGMKVYLGAEYRFFGSDNDYLVFGENEEYFYRHPFSYEGSLPEFRKLAQEENLIIIQAHPFRTGCTPAASEFLDGAEMFNGHPEHNSHSADAKAWIEGIQENRRRLGSEAPFIATVGSDFHKEFHYSGTGILVEELPEDEQALKELLIEGRFETETPTAEEKLAKEANWNS